MHVMLLAPRVNEAVLFNTSCLLSVILSVLVSRMAYLSAKYSGLHAH